MSSLFCVGVGLDMSPETVVISLATSLHLYSNSRALFGQNKQFQKNPAIYIQRDQPLIDVSRSNDRIKYEIDFYCSMLISPMNIFVLKKKKSMNYVNVFNKQCVMKFNKKQQQRQFTLSV
jgi:hypothetical protein